MGYACPVCDTPEADAAHLANHLAVTAMLHGGDHEACLDEHAPDWAERDPGSLGADVVAHAEETDHEPVTGERDGLVGRGPGAIPQEELDPEARRILAEARELTRERSGAETEE